MSRQPLDRGPGPAADEVAALRPPGVHGGEPEASLADVRDAATSALGAFAEAYMCGSSPGEARRGWSHPGGDRRGDPNPAGEAPPPRWARAPALCSAA